MKKDKAKRKIVKINESKCNGCGLCVASCAEGALQIINGKAKLVSETYCDGLGACLCECPEAAITIEERNANEFNQEATEKHLHDMKKAERVVHKEETLPCGCPGTAVRSFTPSCEGTKSNVKATSRLAQWPVQLALVPPTAPFLQGRDLVIAADCVSYAYGNFHEEFLKNKALVIACPKLDDTEFYLDKLTQMFKLSDINSVTVLHMEVPCCSGIVHLTKKALNDAGKKIPAKDITIGIKGDIKEEKPIN